MSFLEISRRRFEKHDVADLSLSIGVKYCKKIHAHVIAVGSRLLNYFLASCNRSSQWFLEIMVFVESGKTVAVINYNILL